MAQDWIAIDLAGMCSDIENGYVCGFTGKNGSAVSLIFIDNINDLKSAEKDLEDICSQAKSKYMSSSDIESIVKEAVEIGYTVGVGLA